MKLQGIPEWFFVVIDANALFVHWGHLPPL